MRAECMSCGKIITNPFIDTDSKGRLYFFCNKEHRNDYAERLINVAFLMNPIGGGYIACCTVWCYIKSLFKKTRRLSPNYRKHQ